MPVVIGSQGGSLYFWKIVHIHDIIEAMTENARGFYNVLTSFNPKEAKYLSMYSDSLQ